MKHKAQGNPLYATMKTDSAWNIVQDLHRDSGIITSHGDCQISTAAANARLSDFFALHVHEALPPVPFLSWKLYENPFLVDGKLDPKYVSRYLNAPLDHAANSFTSVSKGSHNNKSLVPVAPNRDGSLSSSSVHNLSMAPAHKLPRNVVDPTFWEHCELHRRSQARETIKASDQVNVQALGQPRCVSPFDSLKRPALRLDCQIPNANASGEERPVNKPRVNMTACSIQATLANIFQRLRIVEDNQSRSNAAIAKLRLEMEDGSSRIQELEFSHESSLREINSLLQRFGEQMTTSRRKEQEKLRAAFARLREEIEEERNTCRLLKLQNKKLMKELEEASMAAADAGEELDRERQTRELMEEVCNELAREIGEDKVTVEQLKQEQAKSREKVEEELKIMRLAALWKDERVKTKISEAQLELDDKHHMDVPLADLKARVEKFVSTVSASSCESYKVLNNVCKENKDEKQKKIIEQAQLLRHALELSMQQVVENGGVLQVQTDMDLKEENSTTRIIEDQHSQADVCDCCSDKIQEYGRSVSSTAHVELQVQPGNYMVSYSKKPSKAIKCHQLVDEDDLFDHSGIISPLARKHSHDNEVEAEQKEGSTRIILNADYVQAPNQSPSPEHALYEGHGTWFSTRKLSKEHSPPVLVSRSGRGEVQLNESDFHCSPSSSRTSPMKGALCKQSPLHFEPSHNCVEENENADVWQDDLTPNVCRVNRYFENNVSQVCMDDAGRFSMRRPSRKGCPAFVMHTTKLGNATYSWKDRHIREEDTRRDGGCVDNNGECFMHHGLEDAKSQCPDETGSAEDEHGEFDGFYYEPVMDDDLLDDDCGAHYRPDSDGDNAKDAANQKDEHEKTISKPYNRSGHQIVRLKELTCKALPHDGGGQKTSAKSSGREKPLPMSPPPLHKLVLPTPSAIRVSSVKSQYTSPRRVARSLSPSKPQVLQCFRPPPTSPEHVSVKGVVAGSSRGTVKGEGVDIQHSGGSTCINAAHLGEEEQACVRSRGATEEEKGNSLRAELLKARELDLKPVSYSMKNKAAATQPSSNKSSSPSSSSRFSPLRRSLTSSRP
ncbi:hypothetical protein L7F22_053506 [Adiantum nelumboides]|nr:hypothetical protein [Adiantum nelumboides]